MLVENGFSGLLVTKSDIISQKIICERQQKIFHHTYISGSNVLCLCNEKRVSMGCRIIKESQQEKKIRGNCGVVLSGNREWLFE
ncbi:MAG: hypothetical protein IKA80_08670 [Spirochaetaceae bacterium]|nr:hypothetical protein [Spirochaetaceae bacterium]